MYSPSVLSSDVYSLWKAPERSLGSSGTANGEDEHKSVQNSRSLYAPPLMAYSAEYPGASLYQLEYTIASQNGTVGNRLPPHSQRKLERLQRIRNTGYNSIIPIGMKKTMRQLDAERTQSAAADADDAEITNMAENVHGEHLNQAAGGANGRDQTAEAMTTSLESHGNSNSMSNMMSRTTDPGSSINLDAEMPNMDDSDTQSGTFLSEEGEYSDAPAPHVGEMINEDEGFMAEEVEYHEDHSFASEIGRERE